MTYATTYNITGFGKPNTVVAISAKYFDENCKLIFETEPYQTLINSQGEITTDITLIDIPNTTDIKFVTQGTLNYQDIELFCGALPQYVLLFGAIASEYVSNSFVLINGQVQTEDGEPASNITYSVNFPFATTPSQEFTTNENGYFSIQFQTLPNLTFPQDAQLTFTNLLTNSVDTTIDISVADPGVDAFTVSAPNPYYWATTGNVIDIIGNAPSGNVVTIDIPEISFNDTVTASATNDYAISVPIADAFAGNQLTITASTLGFTSEVVITTINRNTFNPAVNFQGGLIYN